jgi:hypothetical protein
MASRLQHLRRSAHLAQNGRCFYCSLPVWERDPESFARAHGLPSRLAKHLRNTAEHLQARQDCGQDAAHNIVAACQWCNLQRHRGRQKRAPQPDQYREWVHAMVSASKWHPVVAHRATRVGGRG